MILRREFDGGRRLCDEPLVHVFDDLVTADESAAIVALARPAMRRSQVSGADGGRYSDGRTSERAWVKHDAAPEVAAAVARIAAQVGLPAGHAEPLQVIHYEVGQEYRPHFDAYDLDTDKGRRYSARGGQRLVTALAYLGDVDGGATGFPRLGLDVEPRRGRVLVFHNCRPGTVVRDPRAYHQGKPPRAGDKWAFNLWFHERVY
jgi:prolyl 4-hydroxylase